MEETVTAVSADNDDNQILAITDTDTQPNDTIIKEELNSKLELKLKSSYRQKYKRAWELDQELRGKSSCYVFYYVLTVSDRLSFQLDVILGTLMS